MRHRCSNMPELAFRAFVRAFGLFRNRMEPYFSRFGISSAQWGVLRALSRAEGEGLRALRLGELSRRLLVKPPSVTGIIDRLERMGLVIRQATTSDQRAKEVSMTPAGRKLLARVLEHHPGRIRAIMAGFNTAQQRQLYELMEQFSSHLESLDAHGLTEMDEADANT